MSEVPVTKDDVCRAKLAQRRALGRDHAIKAEIALGTKWQGADKQTAAILASASYVATGLQKEYDAAFLPRVRAAKENANAAGKSLASNAAHEANLLEQLGQAVRDYVGNGDFRDPNLKHFRSYLERASTMASRVSSSTGSAMRGACAGSWCRSPSPPSSACSDSP